MKFAVWSDADQSACWIGEGLNAEWTGAEPGTAGDSGGARGQRISSWCAGERRDEYGAGKDSAMKLALKGVFSELHPSFH